MFNKNKNNQNNTPKFDQFEINKYFKKLNQHHFYY